MASSLICKKRVRSSIPTISSLPETNFEILPKEIMAEILNKLSKEDLLSTLCLTKSLREKIFDCLPLMKPLSLSYHGLLLQFKTEAEENYKSSRLFIAFDRSTTNVDCPIIDHYADLKTCAEFMQCDKVTSDMLLDCCNGLLLLCNDGRNVDTLMNASFYYYVINPLTKQCIAVQKPNPKSPRSMYAALAYCPFESSYFKIIHFQGSFQLNIFHAEKGEWKNVKHKLPKEITKASWETKSVYNKGALFRVSHSGYLVKILFGNSQLGAQAEAVDLPSIHSTESKCTLGIRDRKILFVSISGTSLLVWELKDEAKYKGGDNNWSLLNVVECDDFSSINCDGQILGIHPYHEVVFILEQPHFYCVDFSTNEVIYESYSTPPDGPVTAFPVLRNPIPFTCNSNKQDNNIFQLLTRIPRKREKYPGLRIRASNYWPSY